ncbi:MFS transporter [Nocardia sp. SYP-A9097]|uniref:MFS transporter n=1 Tax=Nocardia sp. SYP-A9097 TaxID=2663237 RepID=UPI001329758F|nr:MFS transporter [Nocardia sp. SYP-A9097]MRH89431.1 MFS transporter [Nocardia sp. SYP-A9097]
MIDALRNTEFRRLFTAQVVALIGTGLLTVALGLLAYDLAGANAGAVLGIALAVKMLAYVAVAPVISALTERVPRTPLLISADAIRAAIALLLPFVTRTWEIYILIALLQSASATFTPAFQSVIPNVLPGEREYTRALSLSRLAYDLESLLSPILAAAALTVISYHALFVGTAAGFVVSATMVWSARLPRLTGTGAGPLWARITHGARLMLDRPVLRGLLAMNLVVAAATSLVVVNTVVYVRDRLGGSNTGVALALGCFGFGSMVVALVLPRVLADIPDRRVMLTGCRILPVGLVAAAVIPLLTAPAGAATRAFSVLTTGTAGILLAVTWMALGAGTSMINTPSARLLRAESDSDSRTAVFTAQFSLSHACFLLTYPIAGGLGALAGLPITAVVLAVLATLAATTAARVWPASIPVGDEVVAAEG